MNRQFPLRRPGICFGLILRGLMLGLGLAPALAMAKPADFNIPAQSAADALLLFSQQAKTEVLFSFDDLQRVNSVALLGHYEPADAIARLLGGSGFSARRRGGDKFVVTAVAQPAGIIKGRLLAPDGKPVAGARISVRPTRQMQRTDGQGEFDFEAVAPGNYTIFVDATGYQSLQITGVQVEPHRTMTLETQTLRIVSDPTRLDPYIVQARSGRTDPFDRSRTPSVPPSATGNLDLPRTENDALPFTIYDRDQITRSGVVDLNQFLQRMVLDSDAGTAPPEQNGAQDSFVVGSNNLNLRGYGADETVILVNGRRLPEVLTNVGGTLPPDVNFIPLSLVQQVEVLPISASALYNGTAVGGVINIVLRAATDINATEITGTYTNALGRVNAPQSSISLLNGQTLLNGRLRLRFNASFTESTPPTELQLGYHQAHAVSPVGPGDPIYRATPNVRSPDLTPLFGPGTSSVTSVAPGADGTGGLAGFSGREGVRNEGFFSAPAQFAASPDSLQYPYGRRQKRSTYFLSVVHDTFPWLQVGVDATYVHTVVNRGFDVLRGDLTLASSNPLNPFGQDVKVSLNEIATQLGENYSEARLDFASAVVGLLVRLPANWRATLDTQYAHNLVKYRGIAGADPTRWQELVDSGQYNPLRDTQIFGPPQAFYDHALILYGGPDRFVTLGNYDTVDAAVRATNESLEFPTGRATVNIGGDYRRNHLGSYTEQPYFADGTLAHAPTFWTDRAIQRFSVFGELQAPLLPDSWLLSWVRHVATDLAVRYIAADTARETNIAPTFALKVDFNGGLSFRASVTSSNRVPTPQLSRPVTSGTGTGTGVNYASVFDPRRNQTYLVQAEDAEDPALRPEEALTQTAGLLFRRGEVHRVRIALDFVDTEKVNEVFVLDPQAVINLETFYPTRVNRAPPGPGDAQAVGLATNLITGAVNVAKRHSQNWNLAVDYAGAECLGGTLEMYGRLIYFSRYDRKIFPNSPAVDELREPDGLNSGLLRFRSNFGAGWSTPRYGFGVDGHYFHSRVLPLLEQTLQGSSHLEPFWQFDAYLQSDLGRWLPWKSSRFGLRGQFRVNNVFATPFPRYELTGEGVQPYGDWRGRTYSLSLTATF
ncbi:MAG: carboxypeptidase regulatory-like domain-containing protein [Opitutaceae bacterium]